MKVLIIDDDRKFCKALQDFLEINDHKVTTCLLPDEGIKAVEKDRSYDIIFIDFKFENDINKNGADIGARIRDISPVSALVLITAYGEDHIRDYIYVGFDNYIPKYKEGQGSDFQQMHDELKECLNKAIVNSKKRIKTEFTEVELNPVRVRMDYVKRAIKELRYISQSAIAKKIATFMNDDKLSGIINSNKKIPTTYNAHSVYFQVKLEFIKVNGEKIKVDKTIYLEKALKVRQILREDFNEWNDVSDRFEPIRKIKDEFDIS